MEHTRSSFGRAIKKTERGALQDSTIERDKQKRKQAKVNKELGEESQVWLESADQIAERMAWPKDYESKKQLVLQRVMQLTGHDYSNALRILGAVPPNSSRSQEGASFYPSVTVHGDPLSNKPSESQNAHADTESQPAAKKVRLEVQNVPIPHTSRVSVNVESQTDRGSQPAASEDYTNAHSEVTRKVDKGKKRALPSESPPLRSPLPSPSLSPSPPPRPTHASMTSYAEPPRPDSLHNGHSNSGRIDSLPGPMDLLDDFERALPLIDRDEWDKESEQSNRYPRLRGICNSNGNSSEDGEGKENGEGGDEEGKEEDDEDTGDERDERDEGDEDQEDDTLGRNGRRNG
ncbi:hypothetical protein RSOLAG22IIIB_10496 [Rhizoctonia solani]|uniref:Uncharacterized protein n=1 Tax=Rhizoctonia solani TaxID=456999 RepID=A0A0K6G484_9AGAM|nr:hypothetical protein RSOLAG22IIIB_10496 [Rhizoctonia solani]